MDKSDEEKDLYIKSKIKDGHIPEKIDNLFNNSINLEKERGINMNINEINEPQKIKPKKLWVKRTIATAACAVIVLGGGNIYATTQGYENIFFMIKHLVTKDETVHNDKSDILSDRDITISYETINLTENIVMQVQKIQINGKEAKLILAIKEKEAENSDEVVPLKYEVYNSENKILCSQLSSKGDNESTYTEELNLKNYDTSEGKLVLKIFKANGDEITTLRIDVENKTIEVEDAEEALQKISETKLKKFLGEVTGTTCLDISNIEYCAGIYTATFTYAKLPKDTFKIDMNKIDIYQSTITFKLDNTEFKEIKLSTGVIISKAETSGDEKNETGKTDTGTTNKNNNNNNNTSNTGSDIFEEIKNKFVGKWNYAYMTGNEALPKISDIYGEDVKIQLTLNADGTFEELQNGKTYTGTEKGKYEQVSDSMIKMTYTDNCVVYAMYQTNMFGETILTHISKNNQMMYECYLPENAEANTNRTTYVGEWWRTYNVDHDEDKELKLVLGPTGLYEKVDTNYRVLESGRYTMQKDNMFNKIVLKNNNREEELLYSNGTGVRTLHYSKGRQVYKNAEDIK